MGFLESALLRHVWKYTIILIKAAEADILAVTHYIHLYLFKPAYRALVV